MSPFLACGAVAVVGGGLAGAVTRPLDWDRGAWVAAFLVLFAGVGQIGLGAGQAVLAGRSLPRLTIAGEVVLWNAGSLVVLVGTVASAPVVGSAGSCRSSLPSSSSHGRRGRSVVRHPGPGVRIWAWCPRSSPAFRSVSR